MTEVSLVYYGTPEDVGNHLLSILKVLKVMPATSEYSGFYINEKKFGFESQRKISLDITDTAAKDFLIYRYLSPAELQLLKSSDSDNKYHVLLHKFLDATYVQEHLQIANDQLSLLVDYTKSSNIQSFHHARKYWSNHNFAKINSHLNETQKQDEQKTGVQLPVVLLFLAKILVNPVNELKRYYILLKYSNLRVLSRAIELLLFLDFLFKAIALKTLKIGAQQIYYKSLFVAGIFKIILIKLGFLIRHILLMCGFKSFGFFVDTYNLLVRIKDFLINLVVYQIWHFIFYKVGHFLYYRLFYFLYYRVGYFIYYRIIYYVVIDLIYLNSISLFYIIRHAILMTMFKTYGFFYDLALFSYRVTKLYILYPLRKSYWFCSFQYNKRIKKYFA